MVFPGSNCLCASGTDHRQIYYSHSKHVTRVLRQTQRRGHVPRAHASRQVNAQQLHRITYIYTIYSKRGVKAYQSTDALARASRSRSLLTVSPRGCCCCCSCSCVMCGTCHISKHKALAAAQPAVRCNSNAHAIVDRGAVIACMPHSAASSLRLIADRVKSLGH